MAESNLKKHSVGWAGPDDDAADLAHQIRMLKQEAERAEQQFRGEIERVDARHRAGALNLSHYLAVRRFDLRALQESLSRWGLSSLGRTEARVVPTLTTVAQVLETLAGNGGEPIEPIDLTESRRLLSENTRRLFGEARSGRSVRIMVTLPEEAAGDYEFVRSLVAAGMDVARINCAHDDPAAWHRMVAHVRQAEEETGSSCRILMDLAGAKPRSGPVAPGPEVVRCRPSKDRRGRVTDPARVALVPADAPPETETETEPESACRLPVDPDWIARVEPGDVIRLRDTRRKKRRLTAVERSGDSVICELWKTAYFETGTELKLLPRKGRKKPVTTAIGKLPALDEPIILKQGDILVLDRRDEPGRSALRDGDGVVAPARVSCSSPALFAHLRPGEPVKLDDGKIEGVIREATEEEIRIEITLTRPNGSKLRADKSLNFPESNLGPGTLTEKDRLDLDFVVQYADLVGLSFAESVETIEMLQTELVARGAGEMGIVLKIETQRGFEELPRLLFAAMRSPAAGIMIARGDLAVECGWERMAEVQEEILWLCEAAHVPVIWATQVLEGLAKSGIPSRAEITDAAMAERAECVMLNKGPYILRAMHTLDDVLRRMERHQAKKTALLRGLRVTDLLAAAHS